MRTSAFSTPAVLSRASKRPVRVRVRGRVRLRVKVLGLGC